MDYFFDLNRLPSFLVPFVTLSYPVDRPLNPDSFRGSSYYDIGYRDACLIVTFIAVMAMLRDASRLFILEPFANWKLTRDWRRRQARKSGSSTPNSKQSSNNAVGHDANSKVNGHVAIHGSTEKLIADRPPENSIEARRIRHAVMRFAEQGWQAIYYVNQWSLGMVRFFSHLSFLFGKRLLTFATVPLLSSSF
jgi:acyl-CoA-dependent ceramide synthase